MRCMNCGRPEVAHSLGRCPALDTHVVIDAVAIERVARTGHPKLLYRILVRNIRDVLIDVEIDALTLNGQEVKL